MPSSYSKRLTNKGCGFLIFPSPVPGTEQLLAKCLPNECMMIQRPDDPTELALTCATLLGFDFKLFPN